MIETWKTDFKLFAKSLNLSRDDYKTMMEYIDEIPAVQPDHTADIGKKVERTDETAQNVQDENLISKLSEIRSEYNCFDEDGEPYYRALSEAIRILSQLADGDTISRQAAIDALDENIKHFDDMAEECRRNANIERNDYMDMRDDAAEYRQLSIWLNELKWLRERFQLQPEQHWIPRSEKLPEYNESVLTWDGYAFCIEKRIPYIRDDDGEPIEGDWWVSDEYDEYESEYYPNLRDGAAIAWMPLPEPYRGGEK